MISVLILREFFFFIGTPLPAVPKQEKSNKKITPLKKMAITATIVTIIMETLFKSVFVPVTTTVQVENCEKRHEIMT